MKLKYSTHIHVLSPQEIREAAQFSRIWIEPIEIKDRTYNVVHRYGGRPGNQYCLMICSGTLNKVETSTISQGFGWFVCGTTIKKLRFELYPVSDWVTPDQYGGY